MSRIGWVAGLAAWGVLVFLLAAWLAFPSATAAARLAYEVDRQSEGSWRLETDRVSPHWVGAAARNARLFTVKRGEVSPVLFADRASARVGLFGLIGGSPVVDARLRLGDGAIDASAGFADRGFTALHTLELDADDVPVDDLLLAIARGPAPVAATGSVDVAVDLDLSKGNAVASGDLSLRGDGVTLDTLTVDAVGWKDKELGATVDELDLRLRFEEGVGKVVRGVLRTNLASATIDGTVTLAERLRQSEIELTLILELGDWTGTPLESFRSMVEGFLARSQWGDGSYHYKVSTTLGRFQFSDLRPDPEAGGRRRPSLRDRMPVATPTVSSGDEAAPTPLPMPATDRPTPSLSERVRPSATQRTVRSPRRAGAVPDDDLDDEGDLEPDDERPPDGELSDDEFDEIDEAY